MKTRIIKFFSSKIGQIFLAAFLLRIVLLPFFYHSDNKTNYYNSHFLSNGVVNIYEFLAKNPEKSYLGEFSYPILTYVAYGSIFIPLNILLGKGFLSWLSMGNDAVSVNNIYMYLFFTKLPLVFFEFLTGYLLMKLIKDEEEAKIALLFWFFNPINIYTIVFMGQFDIVPTFLIVLALYFATIKKKIGVSALLLGLGGAFKTYPLLFLPFLVFLWTKDWWKRIKLLMIGLFPYLIFILPFLSSIYFRQSSFVSGLSQRMFLLGLNIGFEEQILLVIFAIGILLFAAEKELKGTDKMINYFLAIPLIILSGSHFHPQWAIWITPFLALFLSRNRTTLFPIIILMLGWLGTILLFNDKYLSWGLMSPLDRGVFFLPTIKEMVFKFMSPSLVQSLFHTIFAASAVWISILGIKGKTNEKN